MSKIHNENTYRVPSDRPVHFVESPFGCDLAFYYVTAEKAVLQSPEDGCVVNRIPVRFTMYVERKAWGDSDPRWIASMGYSTRTDKFLGDLTNGQRDKIYRWTRENMADMLASFAADVSTAEIGNRKVQLAYRLREAEDLQAVIDKLRAEIAELGGDSSEVQPYGR